MTGGVLHGTVPAAQAWYCGLGMGELRSLLVQHIVDPAALPDYRNPHSTAGLWRSTAE